MIPRFLIDRFLQMLLSIVGGFVIAIETAIPFFIPCFFIILLDVYSAWALSQRIHKKDPKRSDGKFKSKYKYRVIYTMIISFLLVVVAHYMDVHIVKNSDVTVRFATGLFFCYEFWSILENWSSENDNPFARVLQRIMINKAERHLNIDLSELKTNNIEPKNETNENNK